MLVKKSTCATVVAASIIFSGCSGTGSGSTGPGGGTINVGGAGDTGGSTLGAGGTAASGGALQSGGAGQMGGAPTTGGVVGTGGMPGIGGINATGGSKAVGGTAATGGSQATGGVTTAAGGANQTGGSKATGGTVASGTGGVSATGGSKASATGGAAPTGGSNNATGGTTTTAGGAASFQCNNLTLAPSTTGVAKPSGAVGGLKVLNWAGFTAGAVSFTFDDNKASQLANYAALKATGAHFTWFVVGSWTPSSQYKATLADGQEIANHTYTHQSVSGYSSTSAAQTDLQTNETYINTNFGVTAYSMAAPNCDAAWSSLAPNLLFQDRGPCGTGAATVSARDGTSPFALPAYLPDASAPASTMEGALSSGNWRIYVVHGFNGTNDGAYQPVNISDMTTTMSYAVSSGYWTEGITNVGAYWQGQKAISASASTSATWSLPAHFPPNMCVRITTTGGTVMQNGAAVPWDTHGYYQISLDALSVTIQ